MHPHLMGGTPEAPCFRPWDERRGCCVSGRYTGRDTGNPGEDNSAKNTRRARVRENERDGESAEEDGGCSTFGAKGRL